MSSVSERMVHYLTRARAKIQYIDGEQMGDTPRIEQAAMAARREIDDALREARRTHESARDPGPKKRRARRGVRRTRRTR